MYILSKSLCFNITTIENFIDNIKCEINLTIDLLFLYLNVFINETP